MATHHSPTPLVQFPRLSLGRFRWRKASKFENECPAGPFEALRDALAREELLLGKARSAREEYENLRDESDHRLLNGLQMVVGLLNMQAYTSTPAVATHLSVAAQRVMAIERIHRRLHANDGKKIVGFKIYLEELCSDVSVMLAPAKTSKQEILVECDEVYLPTPVAVPLGFITSELLTNAMKHGNGPIHVRLTAAAEAGFSLVVTNNGPVLPAGFDPDTSEGLGMKIIKSFVRQVGGEIRFGPGPGDEGAKFTILIPPLQAMT